MTISHPSRSEPAPVAEPSARSGSRELRSVTPQELSTWLEERQEAIGDRWLREIRTRGDRVAGDTRDLLGEFVHLLARFLPPAASALRPQVEPLFQQAAELYGNLGAHRGLAAGEAVEEFQLLREVLLRFLHTDPPGREGSDLGLREMLQIHRFVDLGVTYASVGHTDTLFFHLLHGSGVGETPPPEVLEEVSEQIRALAGELHSIVGFEFEERAPSAN